jgi:hypothetical protein
MKKTTCSSLACAMLLMAALAGPLGCAAFGPSSGPDALVAVGYGSATGDPAPSQGPGPAASDGDDGVNWFRVRAEMDGAPDRDAPEGWAVKTLEERVSKRISADARSHVEATLIARRQACDAALSRIASRVAKLPLADGTAVGDAIREDEELRSRLEATIRARTQFVTQTATSDETYEMLARLDLALIAEYVPGAVGKTKSGGWLSGNVAKPETQLEKLAYAEALADARQQMHQRLRMREAAPGYTVADRLAGNPALMDAVSDAVENAKVTRCWFPTPATCKLVLALDFERLARRLSKGLPGAE